MSIEAALARLTAGLDRDEATARAAAERAADWTALDCAIVGGDITPAEPEYGITATAEFVIADGCPMEPEAEHIARQGPKTTLLRVEAIREVIDECLRKIHEAAKTSDDDFGAEAIIEALARIYPDETR